MTKDDEKPASPQSAGGIARADALSKSERRDIAKKAAAARWTRWHSRDLPAETHFGDLKIGSFVLPVAVLSTGQRILKTQGITRAFGSRKKTANVPAPDGMPQPPSFLGSQGIKSAMSPELVEKLSTPLAYRPAGGNPVAFGYEANVLPLICRAIVDARRNKKLTPRQGFLADSAEALLLGLAETGIVALVDEATGYQAVRPKDALQRYLEMILRKELAAWSKRFPDEFYENIYKLKGWPWPGMQKNRYSIVAHYTRDLVYERIAPGLLKELEAKNPTNDKGRRPGKHHQWLTDDVGHPMLAQHLYSLLMFQRLALSSGYGWNRFVKMVDKVLPKKGQTLELPMMDPDSPTSSSEPPPPS